MLLENEYQVLLFCGKTFLTTSEKKRFQNLLKKTLDWKLILKKASPHRVLPLLYFHLSECQSEHNVPQHAWNTLKDAYNASKLRNTILYSELEYVLSFLNCIPMETILLKGCALAKTIYPTIASRFMGDLDLLIPEKYIADIKKMMPKMGYVQGCYDENAQAIVSYSTESIASVEEKHFELVPFVKLIDCTAEFYQCGIQKLDSSDEFQFVTPKNRICYPVEFDFHWNLSLGIDVNEIWNRAIPTSILKTKAFTLSIEDALWFLISRFYHEIMIYNITRLRMFCDIYVLLKEAAEDIDWKYILNTADKYQLHPSLFYVFSHINELTELNIPIYVLKYLDPQNPYVMRYHDWGDFMPKLFGKSEICQIEFTDS